MVIVLRNLIPLPKDADNLVKNTHDHINTCKTELPLRFPAKNVKPPLITIFHTTPKIKHLPKQNHDPSVCTKKYLIAKRNLQKSLRKKTRCNNKTRGSSKFESIFKMAAACCARSDRITSGYTYPGFWSACNLGYGKYKITKRSVGWLSRYVMM